MRDSYLTYVFKLIKEAKFKTLFSQFYKVIAIPVSYIFRKSFCGPVHGILIVNYDCNQRCKMCDLYNRPIEYKKKGLEKLSTKEMMAVIDDFADIGTSGIGFTGGEPILRPDIYDLIKHAKKRGLFTHMSSNGMTIDLEIAGKLLETGLDAISFSLDGSTNKTHDLIRGVKGSFEKVINSIKNCKKVKEKLRSNFVIISVCVINNKNIDEVLEIVNTAIDAGVDKVSFAPIHDIGLMKRESWILDDLRIIEQNLEKVDRVIDELIKIKKTKRIIDNSTTYLKLFKRAFQNKKFPLTCYAGYVSIGVDGYGNIFPCFGWMEMDRKAENIRNISLKDFWNSRDITRMREEIRGCRDCYWNNQAELNITFSLKHLFKP